VFALQSRHPEQVDPASVLLEPIGDFIEQPRVMPRKYRREQEECLGIDGGIASLGRVPGDTERRPLPPEQIDDEVAQLFARVG